MSSIKTIGVLGAGQMGGGIAQVAAGAGYDVLLADQSVEHAKKAIGRIDAILGKQVEKGKMTGEAKAALLEHLKPVNAIADFSACDLVIEAATENVDLKLKLFKECDAALGAGKILASNTSSISVTKLAGVTSRPDRVIGMHFMNPVPLMKLVEIVRAVQTTDETVALVREVGRRMGKTTILVNDSAGFATSRLGVVIAAEAMRMLETGVASAEDIDTAMKLGYRHPMGPLELTDHVGLDVRLAVLEHLHREVGEQFRPPQILRQLVRAGKLGKKTGEGFYKWPR